MENTGEVCTNNDESPPCERELRSHISSTSVKTNSNCSKSTSKVLKRKNSRIKQLQPVATKSCKGRRGLTKKIPQKLPTATATPVTCNYVFYKGNYFQVGDVVSVIGDDDRTYYAQIRGLMIDQYCEKSAVLMWLLPTQASPPPEEGFNVWTYFMGPVEDVPRKIECMEFVCHVPLEFFKHRSYPYIPRYHGSKGETNFISTTISPQLSKALKECSS